MLWKNLDTWLKGYPEARIGWPIWKDLESDSVAVSRSTVSNVRQCLEDERHCLLVGAEGRGKTALARLVGYELWRSGRLVVLLDCGFPGTDTSEQIGAAIVNRDEQRALWIVEDCQKDVDGVESLSEFIDDTKHSMFLFVLRSPTLHSSEVRNRRPFAGLYEKARLVVEMRPTVAEVERVTASYLESKLEKRKAVLNAPITREDSVWALRQTGGNLRTLRAYLEAWNPFDGPLHETHEDAVYSSIIENTVRPLAVTPRILDTFISICVVFQFDIPAWGGTLGQLELDSLERQGLIGASPAGSYRVAHSSDARHVVKAWARAERIDADVFTAKHLVEYFSGPLPRWHSINLMRALGESDWDRTTFTEKSLNELGEHVRDKHDLVLATEFLRALAQLGKLPTSLAGLAGTATLQTAIAHCNNDQYRAFIRALEVIDAAEAAEIEATLTREEKVGLCVRQSLSNLATTVWYYTFTSPKSRPFAKAVVEQVLEADLPIKLRFGSVAPAGKLLKAVIELDEGFAASMAASIAKHVNMRRQFTSEDISLLLTNLSAYPESYSHLNTRLLQECDPAALFAREPRDRFTYVLGQLRSHAMLNPEARAAVKNFYQAFAEGVNTEVCAHIPDRNLSVTIWNFIQMGSDPLFWLRRIASDLHRRLRTSQITDLFWLVWNLHLADQAFCVELLQHSGKQALVVRRSGKAVTSLSLLGLLDYIGISALGASIELDTASLAGDLADLKSVEEILFALRWMRANSTPLFLDVYPLVLAKLHEKGLSIDGLISRNPYLPARRLLGNLFKELEGPPTGGVLQAPRAT